jgi:phospholipase/carboxylesterase
LIRSTLLSLHAIAIPAQTNTADGLIVLLHGWGANAHDLASLVPYLSLPTYQFLLPDAPLPHPYAVGGQMWYNLPATYNFQSTWNFQDNPELIESRQRLIHWLTSLEATTGVPLSRTILGGFSQGGAMTLDVGLKLPLAALMVLSGYLHTPIESPLPHPPPPVLMVHGRQDEVVPLTAAHQAKASLLTAAVPLHYVEFDMGHEIQLDVLKIMQSFVENEVFHLGETSKNDLG